MRRSVFISTLFFVFTAMFFNLLPQSEKVQPDKKSGKKTPMGSVHSFTVVDIDGRQVPLTAFKGKVLLIVNVASRCGYTKQYAGLEELYKKYNAKGLEILAFPCNDFGGQEPGSAEEIKDFCSINYNVTFPLFSKITLKGDKADPLFSLLTSTESIGKGEVGWNFEKFLIDKNGMPVMRFKSKTEPLSADLVAALESQLSR